MSLRDWQHVLGSNLNNAWLCRVIESVNFGKIHVTSEDYRIALRGMSHDFLIFGIVHSDR